MNVSYVLTLLGEDRPGLVEAVASRVTEHDGNWLESRMARMAGEFAGILRIDVPQDRAEALLHSLAGLEQSGLRLIVKQADAGRPGRSVLMRLELLGPDRPGIVREATQALAALGVNVEELQTECISAPMSGESLFSARATVSLPDGVDRHRLAARLDQIANQLTLEIELTPVGES